MKTAQPSRKHPFLFRGALIVPLTLAIGLCGLPLAAQNAPGVPPEPSREATRNVPTNQSVPATLTLPAGIVVPVRLTEWLSSDKNQPGDRFSATLEQSLVANGWVVARRGQIVTGRVAIAQKAGRGSGASQLGVELSELTLVDGQVLPTRTQLVQDSGNSSAGRNAAILGTTTALGAAIGAAAAGGEGAAIGAGAGVTAGIVGVLTTRGKPTIIGPEALLTFRMEVPVTVSTTQSEVAFHPVSQEDFSGDQDAYARRPEHIIAGPAYPPYYVSGYPYPLWYGPGYYPGPLYLGFFGRFGGGFRGSRFGFRR